MALSDDFVESWIARNGALRLRAARTRRVGPERFEVPGLVELCDMLDGKRSVADLVESSPVRSDRLRTGRMLSCSNRATWPGRAEHDRIEFVLANVLLEIHCVV